MSLLKMKLFVVLLYYYVFSLLINVKVGVFEFFYINGRQNMLHIINEMKFH